MMTFEDLLADPPEMKTSTHTLEDGREYLLHDLPASVLDVVYRKSQEKSLPIRDAASVVAHAMLGYAPSDTEIDRMMDKLGSDTILDIFKNALNVSAVTDDNVEAAKKAFSGTTIDADLRTCLPASTSCFDPVTPDARLGTGRMDCLV